MKFSKIFLHIAGVAALFAATACTEEVKYTPAEGVAMEPYYFSTLNTTKIDLVDGQKSFSVYMGRQDTTEALTVEIKSTVSPDANAFTVPASVTFPKGVSTIVFDVTFDLANLVINQDYNIKLELAGINNSPYMLGTLDIVAKYLPWRNFDANESMGIYRDGSILPIFGEEPVQYNVKIQKHPINNNIFRVVNPYGENWPLYNQISKYEGDHYMIVNCEDSTKVYFENFYTGVNYKGAAMTLACETELQKAAGKTPDDALYATLKNGVIAFRGEDGEDLTERITLFIAGAANPYTGNLGADNDMGFKIVLPGYEDESLWEEVGMCKFTDGFFGPIIGKGSNTYDVLVQKHTKEKGIYRVANIYGPESGYVTEAPEKTEWTIIDASNSKCVFFGPVLTAQFGGLKKGNLNVCDAATFELMQGEVTLPEIIASNIGGVLKDNKIVWSAENTGGYYEKQKGVWVAAKTEAVLDLSTAQPTPAATKAKIKKYQTLRFK